MQEVNAKTGHCTNSSDGRTPYKQHLASMPISQNASRQVHHQPCQGICGDSHCYSCSANTKSLQICASCNICKDSINCNGRTQVLACAFGVSKQLHWAQLAKTERCAWCPPFISSAGSQQTWVWEHAQALYTALPLQKLGALVAVLSG